MRVKALPMSPWITENTISDVDNVISMKPWNNYRDSRKSKESITSTAFGLRAEMRPNRYTYISIALMSFGLLSICVAVVLIAISDHIPILAYLLGGAGLMALLINMPIMIFSDKEMRVKDDR